MIVDTTLRGRKWRAICFWLIGIYLAMHLSSWEQSLPNGVFAVLIRVGFIAQIVPATIWVKWLYRQASAASERANCFNGEKYEDDRSITNRCRRYLMPSAVLCVATFIRAAIRAWS